MNPVQSQNLPQFVHVVTEKHVNRKLAVAESEDVKVPNFLGKTLKQSIQEAKLTGLTIHPVGSSGRVVWQSVKPGKKVQNSVTCQIKLESM